MNCVENAEIIFDKNEKLLEVFKKISDAMDFEMTMKESLPFFRLRNDGPMTVRFPTEGNMNSYGYFDMEIKTIRINSGITEEMIELNKKDIINFKFKRIGEKIAYEFNKAIIEALVNSADMENDIIADGNILNQFDLIRCRNKIKLAYYYSS